MANKNIREFSSIVVDGYDRAPSRAMLRAVGFKDADFKKPQIGIASTWSMVTPCNMHIDKLALKAAEGVDQNGDRFPRYIVEKKRRAASFHHAVGDLGDLQFRLDRMMDALELAFALQNSNEILQAVVSHG